MTKGEETRERILARAAALFNEKGFAGASLADLMDATGLQKGGLYNHFESKEQLAVEAFDYAVRMGARRFEQALAGKRHAADRLRAIILVFRGFALDPPIPGGCPLMNTAIENDDSNPVLRQRAVEAMERLRELLRNIVIKGIQRAELKPQSDPDQVATLMLATLEGGLMLSKLYRDTVHLTRAADHLERYVSEELERRR